MIDFRYKLKVDMKTSAPEYEPNPNMPTHLRNIFKLSGPNSSGKSTFMNIVALATHGLKNPSIADSIKVRMRDLIEADYKTLEFELRLEDPVSKTVLRAEKHREFRDITLYESINGDKEKILSSNSFLQNYRLVYDIPENPTGRIRELALELKEWQKGYSDDFSTFQDYVDKVYKTVKASRDDRAIHDKEDEIENAKKDHEKLQSMDKTAEIESLTKLIIAKKLYKAKTETKSAESNFNQMKPHLKPVSGQDADNTAKNNFKSKFLDVKNNIEDVITSSATIGDQELDAIINKLKPITNINQISEKDSFNDYVSDLERLFAYALSLKEPQVDNEARMVNDLLNVLNRYKGEVNYISGIGPLNELIESLEKTALSKGDNSAKRKAISTIKTNSRNIYNSLTTFRGAFTKMKTPQDSADHTMYRRALEFENAYNNAKAKLESLLLDSKQYGMNLDNVSQLIELVNYELGGKYSLCKIEDLENNLKQLREISTDRKNIRECADRISTMQAELKLMKSAETHEYRGKESIISCISDDIQKLRGNYKNAQEKIDAVLGGTYGKFKADDPFFESVWIYFGSRLGYVQHLNTSYEVEMVNIIEDLIIAKDGTVIHMKDMGTGQGQLTYLLGLLSADDNKKIIAMFDEVATMSPSTLSKVFGRFEELQSEGRLMLGMTVLPDDEFTVTQYGLGE